MIALQVTGRPNIARISARLDDPAAAFKTSLIDGSVAHTTGREDAARHPLPALSPREFVFSSKILSLGLSSFDQPLAVIHQAGDD